jgi:heme exporter protein CcmD
MNQWNFVVAAYVVTAIAVVLLIILSWRSMRAAEQQAEELRERR